MLNTLKPLILIAVFYPALRRSLLVLAIFWTAATPAFGSESAIQSLRSFGHRRGPEQLSRVVGVVGFYGQEQPRQWRLLAVDAHVAGLLREYIMEEGEVIAERHFYRHPDQDLPTIPIPIEQLKIDSGGAFKIANDRARIASVGFDAVHYQLRCRDLRHEPIWSLNLLDQKRKTVGVLYISALTGELLKEVWNRPGTPAYERTASGGLIDQWGRNLDNISKALNSARPPKPVADNQRAANGTVSGR